MPPDDANVPLAAPGPVPVAEGTLNGPVAVPAVVASRLAPHLLAVLHMLRRLGKALLVATGLSLLACVPTMITHLPTALLAPITAGYTTGGILRLSGRESLVLSLVFLLLVGLPLPIAHARYGVLATLATPTVVFFAAVAAVYYAVLIGAFAWIGGGGLEDDVE